MSRCGFPTEERRAVWESWGKSRARGRPKQSNEDSMKRLEEIVLHLEKGDIPLQESIAYFEEGTGLLADCSAMLDEAEQLVVKLRKGNDGEPEELPFEE